MHITVICSGVLLSVFSALQVVAAFSWQWGWGVSILFTALSDMRCLQTIGYYMHSVCSVWEEPCVWDGEAVRDVRLKRQMLSRSQCWVGGIGQNLDSGEIGNGPRGKQYKTILNVAFLDLGLGRSAGISLVLLFPFPIFLILFCVLPQIVKLVPSFCHMCWGFLLLS